MRPGISENRASQDAPKGRHMFRFLCPSPSCRKRLKAPEHWVGKATSCPRCGRRFLVPAPAEGAQPASATSNTGSMRVLAIEDQDCPEVRPIRQGWQLPLLAGFAIFVVPFSLAAL